MLPASFSCTRTNNESASVVQDYEVYTAIYDSLFSDSLTPRYLVSDSTLTDSSFDCSQTWAIVDGRRILLDDWSQMKYGWPDIDIDAFRTIYLKVSQIRIFVDTNQIRTHLPVRRISIATRREIFNGPGGWFRFKSRFPKMKGFVGLSRVAIDQQKGRALVFVKDHCGDVCGSGDWYLLERQEGKWRITRRVNVWVS